MPTLREIGEPELVRRLAAARRAGTGVVVDAGDDAAVLRLGPDVDLVATTDTFVEGRHYLPTWSTLDALGARLATANLSDLAAMAAVPRWGLLSIGARAEHDVDDLLALQRGAASRLESEGGSLVGGNVVAVPDVEWFGLTLLGEAARGKVWTRHAARPGDLIAITGHPGRAAAGLRLAQRLGEKARDPQWQPLLDAWLRPVPRVALARALAAGDAVTAAIDISDGAAGDLARLCEASQVGAELDEAGWTIDPALERAAKQLGVGVTDLRLGSGDDYELLLAVDPARREALAQIAHEAGVPLAFVGKFTDAPGVIQWRDRAGDLRSITDQGFDHFTDRSL